MSAKIWILIAALIGVGGVTLGAYHAHGLETQLEKKGMASTDLQKRMDNCATAVRYQMYHALALLGVGMLLLHRCTYLLNISAALFLLGIVGFSGGLYLMVFTGNIGHWAIVPSGGLLLILGWLALAAAALSLSSNKDSTAESPEGNAQLPLTSNERN